MFKSFYDHRLRLIIKRKCEALLYLTGGSDKTRIQINNTPHLSVCTLTIHQQTSDECLY